MKNAINKIYHNKYFPRIFYTKPDGGKDSGVTGYFLIEWKCLFSIGVLRFNKGSREAFHNHAFNAVTFWLRGSVVEEKIDGARKHFYGFSIKPKFTPRNCYHKIIGLTPAFAITFRGPWKDTWNENRNGNEVTLTHARKLVQ